MGPVTGRVLTRNLQLLCGGAKSEAGSLPTLTAYSSRVPFPDTGTFLISQRVQDEICPPIFIDHRDACSCQRDDLFRAQLCTNMELAAVCGKRLNGCGRDQWKHVGCSLHPAFRRIAGVREVRRKLADRRDPDHCGGNRRHCRCAEWQRFGGVEFSRDEYLHASRSASQVLFGRKLGKYHHNFCERLRERLESGSAGNWI